MVIDNGSQGVASGEAPATGRVVGPSIPRGSAEGEGRAEEESKRVEEYRTRLLYLQAEFDNYRKRVRKEMEEVGRMANERLIVVALDLRDDLERTVVAAEKAKDAGIIVEGVRIILRNLDEVLRKEGVAPIPGVGAVFSPAVHEAVAFADREDCEENVVTQEVRKGYTLHGRVIRPSMVEVARKTGGTG
jgi:molecular chaperone GrpE